MPRKRDADTPTPREIYYAARRIAFLLPEEAQQTLKTLLKQGHRGASTHHQVLELVRTSPQALAWMRAALYAAEPTRAYEGLPGLPGSIPARSLWECPKCGFPWRVLRKGRPVPPCPYDGSPLVRVSAAPGDDHAG
ncbi:MAG: hypothetical protein NZ840_13250 [Anaerolineales bacterium]|nr:hypothetical protein [Anaerolineales bacterium]MDW8163001.1 hypothetical protein [Anaerolineales bacterium]